MGIYHVPLPAEYFPAFSFCLNCCVWGALSVSWKFVVLFLLWSMLLMGVVELVACQGFLVRGACVCVQLGGAESLLFEVQ